MSFLPRVSTTTRERAAREFDDLGIPACTDEVVRTLQRSNPELLDMMSKCANDTSDPARTMAGFAMFYRLLTMEAPPVSASGGLQTIPRVTLQTRELLVKQIDTEGTESFVNNAIQTLERENPELLQMAHAFASQHPDYLRLMQGFALVYQSLAIQLASDRSRLH